MPPLSQGLMIRTSFEQLSGLFMDFKSWPWWDPYLACLFSISVFSTYVLSDCSVPLCHRTFYQIICHNIWWFYDRFTTLWL